MSNSFNLAVLQAELKEQFKHKLAATTMNKCHAACLMSVDEAQLLAREEACFRNCFVKSAQFNQHFENELRYTIRQFNQQPEYARFANVINVPEMVTASCGPSANLNDCWPASANVLMKRH